MRILIIFFIALFIHAAPVWAAARTIVYIPLDNRPVCLENVAATAKAAGLEILTPPETMLGNRTSRGNPAALLPWLIEQSATADAIVVSADTLLYGSLVASRTHQLPAAAIEERLAGFAKIKAAHPDIRIYVYSTIMRTPKMSAGGVEPDYYETYGPKIFRITSLRDKAEFAGLNRAEDSELKTLLGEVPAAALADWYDRRTKNYSANSRLVSYARDGTFAYLLIGRDDCSPLSQSHMESRHLAREASGLSAARYASFPGADQLGMLMVARAANDLAFRIPVIKVAYSPGAGPQTIPSYEDMPVGQTITDHILAAGGLPLNTAPADFLLAVNTPENGITLEANSPVNLDAPGAATYSFTAAIAKDIFAGRKVALADIAFANGADNALMGELARRGLLFSLIAYSGWNTASNTLGYTISQGMLAESASETAKDRLIAVRLLDDWAYQANIRGKLAETVLYPANGSYTRLDALTPLLTAEADRSLRAFAATHFPSYSLEGLTVSFPWNRMFEIKVDFETK